MQKRFGFMQKGSEETKLPKFLFVVGIARGQIKTRGFGGSSQSRDGQPFDQKGLYLVVLAGIIIAKK